jgi:GMP synthase-like glutamine amidotransferase
MDNYKVAILQCDDVLDKFRTDFGNYPGMVEDCFTQVSHSLEFFTYDVRKGEYPKQIQDFRFYVITGSKASVYDNEFWISKLVEFVQCLDRVSIPVFGICFGHQIMALAKNCSVEKSSKGWGVGVSSNELTKCAYDLGFEGNALNMIVSHQDQVQNIPQESKLLATSDFCPYFAVQWSDSLISIQGHPEWTCEYSEALMNDRRDRISANTIEAGLESLAKPLDNRGFLSVISKFLLQKA